MFGNGSSSSPSNMPNSPALVRTADDVRAQRRLLAERFGVDRPACAYGFSMGAQQSYHWAALFPEAVERAVIVCGSARTAEHNKVFLLSLMATLEAAPEHLGGGRFSAQPVAALRAFADLRRLGDEPGLIPGGAASFIYGRDVARRLPRPALVAGLHAAARRGLLRPSGDLARLGHRR